MLTPVPCKLYVWLLWYCLDYLPNLVVPLTIQNVYYPNLRWDFAHSEYVDPRYHKNPDLNPKAMKKEREWPAKFFVHFV